MALVLQEERYYDLTLVCLSTMGIMLLIAYAGFACLVTHKGDFYHKRRWKAAILFASVPTFLGSAVLLYFSIASNLSSSSPMSGLQIVEGIVTAIMSTLTLAVPFLFVLTWGTHYRLKWSFNSDDYLDKIWKDPDKGHKSPIREL